MSGSPERREQCIVLIGLRGAGKTSVGKALAARLGWEFVDSDDLVTEAAGATIREIFERFGEQGFRALERDAIARIVGHPRQVISVGGGAVLLEENRRRLGGSGPVIWLTAPVEELESRIGTDPATAAGRPALSAYGSRDELAHLLILRGPLYAQMAAMTIDTSGRTVAQVADEIAARLPSLSHSEPPT